MVICMTSPLRSGRGSSRAPLLETADAFGNAARSRAEPEQQLASEHRSSAILDVADADVALHGGADLDAERFDERIGAGLAIGEAHLDRGVGAEKRTSGHGNHHAAP